ncbi:MAG: transcription elongation factor GreA [Candidatus Subteraquimicrobiales bacterium]|nr:transcription elongation factor GreA [Candidatus Subteraquimicrobiales bacterium]
MKQGADYITEEKKKTLEMELKELMGPKRREILDNLEYAKSLGDLSENAEYHQAREDQGRLEARIQKIEQILQSSHVVSGGGGDIIEIGSNVIVQKVPTPKGLPAQAGVGTPTRFARLDSARLDGASARRAKSVGEKISYTIVGSEEADMVLGKISNRSPFGEALFGKKKGDVVSFKTPNGIVNYKIINVF